MGNPIETATTTQTQEAAKIQQAPTPTTTYQASPLSPSSQVVVNPTFTREPTSPTAPSPTAPGQTPTYIFPGHTVFTSTPTAQPQYREAGSGGGGGNVNAPSENTPITSSSSTSQPDISAQARGQEPGFSVSRDAGNIYQTQQVGGALYSTPSAAALANPNQNFLVTNPSTKESFVVSSKYMNRSNELKASASNELMGNPKIDIEETSSNLPSFGTNFALGYENPLLRQSIMYGYSKASSISSPLVMSEKELIRLGATKAGESALGGGNVYEYQGGYYFRDESGSFGRVSSVTEVPKAQRIETEGLPFLSIPIPSASTMGAFTSEFAGMELAGMATGKALSNAPKAIVDFVKLGDTKVSFGMKEDILTFGEKPGGYAIGPFKRPTIEIELPKKIVPAPEYNVKYVASGTIKEQVQDVKSIGMNEFEAPEDVGAVVASSEERTSGFMEFTPKQIKEMSGTNLKQGESVINLRGETPAASMQSRQLQVKFDTFTKRTNEMPELPGKIKFETSGSVEKMTFTDAYGNIGTKVSKSDQLFPLPPEAKAEDIRPMSPADIKKTPLSKTFGQELPPEKPINNAPKMPSNNGLILRGARNTQIEPQPFSVRKLPMVEDEEEDLFYGRGMIKLVNSRNVLLTRKSSVKLTTNINARTENKQPVGFGYSQSSRSVQRTQPRIIVVERQRPLQAQPIMSRESAKLDQDIDQANIQKQGMGTGIASGIASRLSQRQSQREEQNTREESRSRQEQAFRIREQNLPKLNLRSNGKEMIREYERPKKRGRKIREYFTLPKADEVSKNLEEAKYGWGTARDPRGKVTQKIWNRMLRTTGEPEIFPTASQARRGNVPSPFNPGKTKALFSIPLRRKKRRK